MSLCQRVQGRAGGKTLLHHDATTGPKPQQHAEQEQRMGIAPRCQNAAAGIDPECFQADAKTLGPGLMVASEALGQAGAARGVADVKRRQRLRRRHVAGCIWNGGLYTVLHGNRPIRVSYGCAAPAGKNAHEIHQALHQSQAAVDPGDGRGPFVAEGCGAFCDRRMQSGKG